MKRDGYIRTLHLLRHTEGTSIADKISILSEIFSPSIIPAYHVIPQWRKNNHNYTTT